MSADGDPVAGGLSQLSSDENGTLPFRSAGDVAAGLTDQQARAVGARGVSVALSAGERAARKTFVLTERYLAELDPDNPAGRPRLGQLVAITFTERAAREMRGRIRKAMHETSGIVCRKPRGLLACTGARA